MATKHGYLVGRQTTKTYSAWRDMRHRCRNPNHRQFKYWGGKGVTVCERWDDFINFLDDMGEAPPNTELDRIDSNLGYEPGNCIWATKPEASAHQTHRGGRTGRPGPRKLTPDQVRAIRADARSQQTIADELGVSQVLISLIKRGKLYRNV